MNIHNSKGSILLIADEPLVLDLGRLMLEKLGYKVLLATNGMEAPVKFLLRKKISSVW